MIRSHSAPQLLYDRLKILPLEIGLAVLGVAHMHMHDGRAGPPGPQALVRYLLGAIGHIGIMFFHGGRTHDGRGDDKFIHDSSFKSVYRAPQTAFDAGLIAMIAK